jgi:ABC-2 type transport system ATP-binding protein
MSRVPAFTLTGVVKRYPGFTLGPLDLTLEPGTVVGFVGPNGSGNDDPQLHRRLVVPEAGSVDIFGRPVDHRAPAWKADVGVVGEAHGFYKAWTAEENLRFLSAFYPAWSDQLVKRLTGRLGLPLDKKVETLSKGHLAKLAMVAALGHGPRLLLLDEPTAGLDPVVRAEVLDVLWEVLEDGEHAIFYSTHVLSDISRLADELVFLRDGQVLLPGARTELTGRWRRISFRLTAADVALAGAVEYAGCAQAPVVTTAGGDSGPPARDGAEAIGQSRMTIDEIAVAILKEATDTAAP